MNLGKIEIAYIKCTQCSAKLLQR